MLRDFSRQLKSALLRPLLDVIPVKNGLTAVTFHNLKSNEIEWFGSVARFIAEQYEIVDPKDFVAEKVDTDSNDVKVMFTFDDGFVSNRLVAEKYLSEYGIKGLFFLTESFIGNDTDNSFSFALDHFFPNRSLLPGPKEQYASMSWSEVAWLIENGHSMGAHTKTHRMLSHIADPEIMEDEVVASAERMESVIGTKLTCFAYPFGSVGSINEEALRKASGHFDYSFSNVRGEVSESPSNHFIFRQNLVPGDPIWLVRAIIEGRLDWKYRELRKQSEKIVVNSGI